MKTAQIPHPSKPTPINSSIFSLNILLLSNKIPHRLTPQNPMKMELSDMQRNLSDYTTSLFREGYLDNQFTELQQLQDDSNPEFVKEVVSLFFDDSERLLRDLSSALNEQIVDFKKVDAHVHQFKGSSSSIGAQRVKNACIQFRSFCEEQNVEACRACLQQVTQEFFLVKNKLQDLLRMEHQITSLGGSIPVME